MSFHTLRSRIVSLCVWGFVSALKMFLTKEIHSFYGETSSFIFNYDIFVDRVDPSLVFPWYFGNRFDVRVRFFIFGWHLIEIFNRNRILLLLRLLLYVLLRLLLNARRIVFHHNAGLRGFGLLGRSGGSFAIGWCTAHANPVLLKL